MKHYKMIIGTLMVSLVVLTGCGQKKEVIIDSKESVVESDTESELNSLESSDDAGADEEPSFSNFKAINLDGEEVNQDIFSEYDLTMINIWATFCGPCLREMPDLGEIHEEYKDKNFQIVGIVTDVMNQDGTLSKSQLDTAREIVEKTGADYMHILPSYDIMMAKLKDVTAVPETIFVDQDGNLVGTSYLGAKSKEDWMKIIDELME